MDNYTLEKHINNVELLKRLYTFKGTENETEMFSIVNALADFVRQNVQYSPLKSINMMADLLVGIIDFANSDEYDLLNFSNRFKEIFSLISMAVDEISDTYKTNIYFMGKDKYGLINTVINDSVNFAGDFRRKKADPIENDSGFNILLLSEEIAFEVNDLADFKIVHYDKFMNNAFNLVEEIYYRDYDFNFLTSALNLAKKTVTDAIFLGHSYSLNGLDDNKLNENVINLSLSSQDLYYSFIIAKEVIERNQKIRKCYIGTGYWTFFLDLSMAQNVNELARIETIYYPIFKDSHNCRKINIRKKASLDEYMNQLGKFIFDSEKIFKCLSEIIYSSNRFYFNDYVKREAFSLIKNNRLSLMNDEIKFRLGRERAELHNKMLRYDNTRNENEEIIKEFLAYLNKKNVQTIIVNFPTTKYYNEFLSEDFKQEYYRIFESLKKEYAFQLVDLNIDNNLFDDDDFRDFDHLNDSGAEKVSNILNQTFNLKKS